VYVHACLLLHLASCALLGRLVLISFSLRKAKLVPNPYGEYFSAVLIEDDGATDRFVLLEFGRELLRIDFNSRGCVLFEFEEKFVSVSIPIFQVFFPDDFIDVIVEGFFSVETETIEIFEFLLGKVDNKFR
jgi:hypothetical protein